MNFISKLKREFKHEWNTFFSGWDCILFSSFILHPSAFSSDWLQFRGPNGAGYAADARIPAALKIEWSADLPGRGLSSPIIVGGKVFVSCSSGPKQEKLHVICFNAADGRKSGSAR